MDLGVRPQHKMLWGEDLGPETDVDNPEVPRDNRPESSQGEVVDVSSESEEEEWKYVKGATKPEDKKQLNDQESDNKSQLNPNASEFVPGVEKFNPLDKDDFIASSPGVSQTADNNLDDIDVPSETEFEHDISTRACDLEPAADIGEVNVVAEPDDTKKIENFSSIDEVKAEGVSLILTPQTADPILPETVQKVDTNPFASDMEPRSTETDKVDFVQDYFGKNELDFKPFESVTPHHDVSEKPFNSEDLTEPQIPNSVSAEISYHFNFINSHLDNGENIRPEESEKERNQLEIKEPESPANSESCSNGVIEHDEHHNVIEDFPVDKTSELEISSDKSADVTKTTDISADVTKTTDKSADVTKTTDKSADVTKTIDKSADVTKATDNSEIEHEIFGVKSEKDLCLTTTDITSDVSSDEKCLFETKDILSQDIEEETCFGEGPLSVSHKVDVPALEVENLEKNVEVDKGSVCELVNNKPVITNFVEEVLSDIPQTENENKENGAVGRLNDFHFDSSPILLTGDSSPTLKLEEKKDIDADEVNQTEEIKNDANLFDEDTDHIGIHEDQFREEKDHTELLIGKKNNISPAEPFVSNEVCKETVLDKNEEIISHDEVIKCDTNTRDIESEHKDIISSIEEITCSIPCDGINSNYEEIIICGIIPKEVSLAEEIVSSDVPHLAISSPDEEITCEISQAEFTHNQMKENVNISEDDINEHSEPQIELADTIGPNAFNFSQPYEIVEIHGMTPIDFIGLRRNDIMTTSMHESLEQDSSFEFVSESAMRETVIEETADINNKLDVSVEDVPATFSEPVATDTHKLENGVDHIEFSSGLLSSVNEFVEKDNVTAVFEAESAIIESHEVPVSSQPDLVFVEKICPTVEVRSDEASPVNKENGGFELIPALSAAGITTALGATAVALAALPDQQESEHTKKEDTKATDSKTSSKSFATKAAMNKKPGPSATAKPPVAKAPAKIAPTKTPLTAAKPKVPTAAKSAVTSTANKTRPIPLASKTATTATKLAPTAGKPTARATTALTTKAPSKPTTTTTTTAKSLTTANKPAARPLSAPIKSAPLLKSAAAAKTSSSAPRAPLAPKKLPTSTAKPSPGSKTAAAATENKVPAKTAPLKMTAPPTTRPSVPKMTSTIGAKPPTRLGVSAVPANKLKATSPTKPAPIKAKSPLPASKRPTSASGKKTSTVLDKNAKNTVKSVPKETAQKEIITSENQLVEGALTSTTTNGHHIENGNVTPLEEIPSHIM